MSHTKTVHSLNPSTYSSPADAGIESSVTSSASQDDGDHVSPEIKSTLVSKNVTILGRRTSVRLEPEMWLALKDIARREGCSMHDICSLINLRKNENTSLTAAIRVFLMLYYRAAATEEGHARAGHGDFDSMKRRARVMAETAARPSSPSKQPSSERYYESAVA